MDDNTKKIKGTLHNSPEQVVEFTLTVPPVGKGGNAWVYRAYANDGTNNKTENYIIKILHPSIDGLEIDNDGKLTYLKEYHFDGTPLKKLFEQRRRLMLLEADMMHRFQLESVCMNITAIFDYNDTLAVAMPISGGYTLSECEYSFPKTALEVEQILDLGIQTADRIRVLHSFGKLHMDISPDNIFLQKDGAVRLLDFGSMCDADHPVISFSRKQGFSAPETENFYFGSIEEQHFGFEADIYSIGATIYYLIFGHTFNRKAPCAYYFDEISTLPVNEGTKELLFQFFRYVLAFTPSLRCSDINELINQLKQLLSVIKGFGVSAPLLFQKSIEVHHTFEQKNILLRKDLIDENLISFDITQHNFNNKNATIGSAHNNIFIVGDSGSGKTSLLILMWNQMLEHHKSDNTVAIPLFISLGSCPDCSKWRSGDPMESYILRALCVCYYGAADFSSCSADIISGIWEEFSKPSDKPQYFILVDGLNEVPAESRSFLIDELNRFSVLDNVRLAVTSRYTEFALESFELRRLVGIREERVSKYLRSNGFSTTEFAAVKINRTLFSMLCSPIYLNMAVQMKKNNVPISDITRTGQLLNRYFSSDIPGSTNEPKRLSRIGIGRGEQFNSQINFIYNFLMPYIAFYMDQENCHSLTRIQFEEIISSALDENIGWFASELFIGQKPEFADTILELYCAHSTLRIKASVNKIANVIYKVLGLMIEHNNCIEFLNRTTETYFAAKYICMVLELSVYSDNILPIADISRTRWHSDTMCIAGDILYDTNSKAAYNALDMLRGKIGAEYTLITAAIIGLIQARDRSIDGKDLSYLDLTECNLADTSCKGTNFDGSALSDEVILGTGNNTYTSAVSPDGSMLFLMSGNGNGTVIDATTNTRKRIALDSRCDMCIGLQIVSNKIYTLGRCDGELNLCMEIFSYNGTLVNTLAINAKKYDSARQYKDIKATFSADGAWLVICNSPVYHNISGELLLVNCVSGEHYSLDAGDDITGLRFTCGKLYVLCRSGTCQTISLDATTFVTEDKRSIRDRINDAVLLEEDGELFLVCASKRAKLNVSPRITRAKGVRYTLYSAGESYVCLVRPRESGISYLAYFNDKPTLTIHADVQELCSEHTALVMRSELSNNGQIQKCFGLYDIIHEKWIVREQSHRGMQCGAVSGDYMLMSRGGEAVLCNMNSGRFTPLDTLGEHERIWLSSCSENRLRETVSGSSICLYGEDGSETIAKELFGINGNCRLSVLNVSSSLRYVAIQADIKQHKRLYLYDRENKQAENIPIAHTVFGHPQAHILRDRQVALLAETGAEKRWILQLCGVNKVPLSCDVTEYKSSTSKLMLLHDGKDLYLVSFGRSRSRKPWRYGKTSVTRVIIENDRILLDETHHHLGCCVSNPRVTCRYTESRWLVMKKRFTDSEYILLDLRTGKEQSIYLDGLRLEGSSFVGAVGLSDQAKEILRNAGAKME